MPDILKGKFDGMKHVGNIFPLTRGRFHVYIQEYR